MYHRYLKSNFAKNKEKFPEKAKSKINQAQVILKEKRPKIRSQAFDEFSETAEKNNRGASQAKTQVKSCQLDL